MADDLALEALTDFLNGVEAGIEAARQTIKKAKKIDEDKLDFSRLFWEKKTGTKGEFEQTSERANGNNDLWKALRAKLKESKGFWQHAEYKYWNDMQQETIIDRRKVV